ncbi:MAG TPA: hypothetical protein VGM92_00320 [Candidatus Kapabacteria bacterium]|jgi:hypothetical protein
MFRRVLIFLVTFLAAAFSAGLSSAVHSAPISQNDSASRPLQPDSVIVHLSIPQNYLTYSDSDITVSQYLTDSLSIRITGLFEYIYYNSDFLTLLSVANGAATPLSVWTVNSTQFTPGIVRVSIVSTPATAVATPGEVLRLLFHVQDTARAFEISDFADSVFQVLTPATVQIISDSGKLMVIDGCVPVLETGKNPKTDVVEFSNPITSTSHISYFATGTGSAQFRWYSVAGSLVQSMDADASPGWHDLNWNSSAVPQGMYVLEYEAGFQHTLKTMLVLH